MRPNLQHLQPTHATARTTRAPRVRVSAIAVAVAGFALFIATTISPAIAPATPLATKRAQAAKLNAEVDAIVRKADELQEQYRGQQYELKRIQTDVAEARVEVASTRRSLGVAKVNLTGRAVAVYQAGGSETRFVDVALDGGFSTFFEKMDTIQRVGARDTEILESVQTLNAKVEAKQRALAKNLAKQSKVVAASKKSKAKIDAVVAERQAKLDSVNADIQAIMEQQRAAAAAAAAKAARESAARMQAAAPANGASNAPQGDTSSSSSPSSSPSDAGGVSIPLPPGSSTAAAAANAAMGKLGSPYVWGAAGPNTFDCSGLVAWAFAQAGRPGLPHSTYALINMGVEVPMDQLQVGDLLFSSSLGHMAIYIGGGNFVHAPHSGDVVKVTSLSSYGLSRARRL